MITVTSRKLTVVNNALTGVPDQAAKRAIRRMRPTRPPARRPVLGLGDLVERVAKPLAKRVDRATARLRPRWRTKLAGCSACSRRRAFLNWVVRDVRRWREWAAAWRRLRPAWERFYARKRRA